METIAETQALSLNSVLRPDGIGTATIRERFQPLQKPMLASTRYPGHCLFGQKVQVLPLAVEWLLEPDAPRAELSLA